MSDGWPAGSSEVLRPSEPDGPLGLRIWCYLDRTFAIVEYEVRKLRHDPSELIYRAIQPALWLVIFGEVFSQIHAIPTGNLTYLEFLAPGILAQSVMFIAIFYGIASIRERDLGIIYKFLVSPAARTSLVTGKALSASVRGLSQALIIYILAFALGVVPNLNPLAILGVIVIVVLTAMLFATLSLIIASLVKTQEKFIGIGQLITMPLFFASNAIYPISVMPAWLQPIALANPLTYAVDGLRTLMVNGGPVEFPIAGDFAILLAFTIAFILIESRLYPRMAQ